MADEIKSASRDADITSLENSYSESKSEKLRACGKCPIQLIEAAMRKLINIAL
jgi:hypothetical protein